MLDIIITCSVTTVIGILITYFFTSLSAKRSAGEMVKDLREEVEKRIEEYVVNHVNAYHQDDARGLVDDHTKNCQARAKLDKIEKALIFLVMKAGGNLSELGLD